MKPLMQPYSRRQLLKWGAQGAAALAGLSLGPTARANQGYQRVVALTSLAADLVVRLDRDRLVGVSGGSIIADDPRFAGITSVGLGSAPSVEQIVALEPDWVIGASGFHTALAERLQAFSIESYLTTVDRWQSLETTTQDLATGLAVDPAAVLQETGTFLPESLATNGQRVLLLVGVQPILSPNRDSWAGDLLTRFGLTNLTADLQSQGQFRGYVTLSAERILEAEPDIILVVDPETNDPLTRFQGQPFWQNLRAVQQDQVFGVPYYGMVNPGTLAAIAQVCEQLASITQAA